MRIIIIISVFLLFSCIKSFLRSFAENKCFVLSLLVSEKIWDGEKNQVIISLFLFMYIMYFFCIIWACGRDKGVLFFGQNGKYHLFSRGAYLQIAKSIITVHHHLSKYMGMANK